MLDLLAFKATDVPANNVIVNGDFSRVTNNLPNGFSNIGAVGTTSVQNNILSMTKGSSNDFWGIQYVPNLNFLMGNKYYVSAKVSCGDSSVNRIRYRLAFGTEPLAKFEDGTDVSFGTDIANHKRRSTIKTAITSGTAKLHITAHTTDFASGVGAVLDISHVIVMDLTSTFGAGDEPSVQQMDALLMQFPNSWFGGTRNLFNAKHFMGMYYKKIKELENAITALGGGA